ncbi:MFS transporter [Candidatus Nitrotoga fabula]|uniref:Inner membrane transport protein YajR n=1 Tax=Candidatus Nitrotoga fabula TaxID=2182327 RepID=A0A916BGS4_9PROT|nr:MFS transporter [Candidatus Nitrotoga fabula]CAE6741283.1 Inner membrane transport protein YajR [Candidatus Nitrotoga fabula]
MTPIERRASMGLAAIYGLRMLGLFIILPILALYASERLPGGENPLLIGIALGAYGLTQAVLQIPAGWMSDRYGRKPVIYAGLLLFAIGSFLAASAENIYWIIAGRAIQGAGAINAAVMALTADLTREEVRTKAMAMIGITIGITFSISLVLAPVLYQAIDVPGIFVLTGALALLAVLFVAYLIPNPAITRFHSGSGASRKQFGEVLRNRDLLRLDFGIFSLHAILMSVFMQVPFVLKNNGLDVARHWQVYLPVMLLAFVLMVPPIIVAEKKAKMKQVFIGSIALATCGQLSLMLTQGSIWGVVFSLLLFFVAFNVLEATLPSMISKIAPLAAKGTAMGIYSSVQFLGAFSGAFAGGFLLQNFGGDAVFAFAAGLLLLWLLVASTMNPPAAVRTKMYPLSDMDAKAGAALQQRLSQLPGVREALVVPDERMACLKVDMSGFDEAGVHHLVKGE